MHRNIWKPSHVTLSCVTPSYIDILVILWDYIQYLVATYVY